MLAHVRAQLRDIWIVNNVHECCSKIVNSASIETEVMNEYTHECWLGRLRTTCY